MLRLADVSSSLETLRDWVRFGASEFTKAGLCFGHGTDNALDEALALVLFGLHLDHKLPESYWSARLVDEEKKDIYDLFQRRIEQRIPAAYLTQEGWFAGLPFYVDERVLVPRSPIAELIEDGFEPWIEAHQVDQILDLCTGSGCIGIACAYAFPDATIDLVDCEESALAVAADNVRRHHLDTDQVRTVKSDLFSNLNGASYDIIVSNPPYVAVQELHELAKEFHHEPSVGLAGGEDGLDCVIEILRQARAHLNEHGILVVEVGNSAAALVERFPQLPFLWLEFRRGGEGVFLLRADQLQQYQQILHDE